MVHDGTAWIVTVALVALSSFLTGLGAGKGCCILHAEASLIIYPREIKKLNRHCLNADFSIQLSMLK